MSDGEEMIDSELGKGQAGHLSCLLLGLTVPDKSLPSLKQAGAAMETGTGTRGITHSLQWYKTRARSCFGTTVCSRRGVPSLLCCAALEQHTVLPVDSELRYISQNTFPRY